jgi:two-component system OmpR family response regulator
MCPERRSFVKTIAIIEDDQPIGDLLEEVLEKEGYQVKRAYSGTEALYLLSKQLPDLVLLDLMLPGLSGEQVLEKLSGVPVIVVSAKVGVDDKVRLLLGGAADYITKPFEIKELLARIQVQLRKSPSPDAPVYRAGDLTLDTLSREVTLGGEPVHLTKTEYAILKLLMQNPTQAVAKSVILDRIAQDTPDCTESSLKQHVSNLRKKLRDVGGRDLIQAVWGIGFRLNLEREEDSL